MSVVSPVTNDPSKTTPTTSTTTDDDDEDDFGPEFEEAPSYTIFGRKVDKVSFLVFSGAIAAWSGLWYFTGIRQMSSKAKMLYLVFVFVLCFFLINMFTSDVKSADYVTEELRLNSIDANSSVMAALLVGLALFSSKLSGGDDVDNKEIFTVLCYSLIPVFVSMMYVSTPKEGDKIRTLRKVKQALYNLSIGLLLIVLVFVLIKRR